MERVIRSSAPGRICLFGEHQDYLGLPVVAAAIDLRVAVRAMPNAAPVLRVRLVDIGQELLLDPGTEATYSHDRDYLPAAMNILRRQGLRWESGWEVEVTGNIPLNSGASSSSALQVAWCAFLLAAANDPRATDPLAVASLAHQSEVTEFGSPGGMMDHYSSAVGGALWLDCGNLPAMERFSTFPGEFVLVDSGIPKDTNGVLGTIRARADSLPPGWREDDFKVGRR
jgi:galactokinase